VSIKTTVAKAKEARRLADRLINIAKRNDLHARRLVLATVRNKQVVRKLFSEIAPRYAERNGGYTRVVSLGHRYGDGAELAILELVGYEGVQKARIEAQREKREAKKKEKEKKAEEKAPAAAAEKED
jgi:large subunit ribosomal protein L17